VNNDHCLHCPHRLPASVRDRQPRLTQAFLTTTERDNAMAAYRRRGAVVVKDGARGLAVIATRWEDGSP